MPTPRPAGLVARLGGSAAAQLGIELAAGDDAALGRWLVAACLVSASRSEQAAQRALRALSEPGLAELGAIRASGPLPVARALEGAGLAKADQIALTLSRASAALAAAHRGSLRALARDAEGLDELAARLCALAPGIGRATAALFLSPLRELWPAAGDLPLAAAATRAAHCLGWLRADQDPESAAGTLRARLAGEPDAPTLADLEGALARLGAAACARHRPERCPLAADCPQRSGAACAGASSPRGA